MEKYEIDNQKFEELVKSLIHSNEVCLNLYDKYYKYFINFKDSDPGIAYKTGYIVFHIKEIKKNINYLNTNLNGYIRRNKNEKN